MESAVDVQARLVVREAPKTMLLGVASAWLLAMAMCSVAVPDGYVHRAMAWAGILSLLLLRGVAVTQPAWKADDPAVVHAARQRLLRNATGVAFMWGVSSSVLLPGADFEHVVLLVVAISLIAVGGTIGRVVHMPSIAFFITILTTVFAFGLIAQPGHFARYIGFGYLLFGPVITLFARAQGNQIRRERELNLEIERLLSQTRSALEEAERARADAEQARQDAERMSAARTRFLATASHDLRQPMHSIGLIVGILHDRLREPGLLELTGKVQASVASLEQLFASLLDISKLDAGIVQPELVRVDVARVMERVADTWRPLATERGLQLRMRPGKCVARSDPQLLERIVGNLVSNAIRYTSRGGLLFVCRRRAGGCAIQVWDTGAGIESGDLSMIFEEFYRVDAGRKGHGEGLGLGLSIVQRSAQLLGHGLRVTSRPGRGSMFELWLETSDEPWPGFDAIDPPEESGELSGAFVAIVDDDAHNREALAHVFRGWGCHVVVGGSARELAQALACHLRTPDLLVTDYRLGANETGLDLVTEFRRDGGEDVPVLLLTADTSPDVDRGAAALGLGVLRKPVGVPSLRRAAIAVLHAAAVEARSA